MDATFVPAAQYLRMSTDHQQYSLDNQSDAITRYATEHPFQVIKTYSDPAKSGLRLKNRAGLKQLLEDVVDDEKPQFRAILVYDVSRWGRFQDHDERLITSMSANRQAFPFTTARKCSALIAAHLGGFSKP